MAMINLHINGFIQKLQGCQGGIRQIIKVRSQKNIVETLMHGSPSKGHLTAKLYYIIISNHHYLMLTCHGVSKNIDRHRNVQNNASKIGP